jgi:transcriptional regulator with XRE-family HTH domain
MYYKISKPCASVTYGEKQVKALAKRMKEVGYDTDRPIVLWNGTILDGRHRYLASQEAEVEPNFIEFKGTEEEAWDYVIIHNDVDGNRPIDREFFYVQRANALGVQSRGGDRQSEEAKTNRTNVPMVPTQEDHADALGVTDRTVRRWEADRNEIMADPELSEKATTPEGYKEAKKELKRRRDPVIPNYRIDEAMGAIKGISELYSKRYQGTKEEAASVLISELIRGCETDDIGLSIARDYVKWFLSLKEVLDVAEPELIQFLQEQPTLKLVN